MAANARYLWSRLEAYHGLIYFAPEADQHYTCLLYTSDAADE